MTDKQAFLRGVTVIWDSRERKNKHILNGLDALGVPHESRKIDVGDYSFSIAGRDFATACAIERKSGPGELYSNIMERMPGNMNRLEKELNAGDRLLKQFTLLVEGIANMKALREYVVPKWTMEAAPQRIKADIGGTCYASLRAWQMANRYNFRVEFVPDKARVAARMLEEFFYYHQNYKKQIAPRKAVKEDEQAESKS